MVEIPIHYENRQLHCKIYLAGGLAVFEQGLLRTAERARLPIYKIIGRARHRKGAQLRHAGSQQASL